MSKKSLFKSLIPGLVAVSFAGWGSIALAADPIVSGDILGEPCVDSVLIAAFNLPELTGGGIVKLPDGMLPGAIEMSGDESPFKWENVMAPGGSTHNKAIVKSIEIFGVVGDGDAATVEDQSFSEPYPVDGTLPQTEGFTALYQVYFCGTDLLVEMSDASVKLANGEATFSVDPVSEMKEKAVSYKAVCTAESNPINADGRTNYEVNVYENGIECHIEELDQNGKTFDHEAEVK
jgi:hypothetical protein